MSVLDGPRTETRRILHAGVPIWVEVDGDRLALPDGRAIAERDATYLAPCEPTKILCVHLNYESRRIEFRAGPLVTPTYFQKPVTALNALGTAGGTPTSPVVIQTVTISVKEGAVASTTTTSTVAPETTAAGDTTTSAG